MNEALLVCAVFVLLFSIRRALRRAGVQAYLHTVYPELAPVVQHHSLVYIFLLVFVGACIIGIFQSALPVYRGVEDVEDGLNRTLHTADELSRSDITRWQEKLSVTPGLLAFSKNSPIAVCLTMLVCGAHVRTLVLENSQRSTSLKWWQSHKQDMILQILLLPAVYAAIILHCLVRTWAVLIGEGWSQSLVDDGLNWADAVQVHMEHYKANLAVANLVEMHTLICFSTLCLASIREGQSSNALERPFRNLLMHGLYGFVLVGCLKIACELWICGIASNQSTKGAYDLKPFTVIFDPGDAEHEEGLPAFFSGTIMIDATLLQMIDGTLHVLLIIASMQGLYCIVKVCSIPELAQANARWKFLGTEILVTTAQLQYAGLEWLACYDSTIITAYQARLLHASLLCYECFIVSVLHWRHWAPEDYCEAGALDEALASAETVQTSRSLPAPGKQMLPTPSLNSSSSGVGATKSAKRPQSMGPIASQRSNMEQRGQSSQNSAAMFKSKSGGSSSQGVQPLVVPMQPTLPSTLKPLPSS